MPSFREATEVFEQKQEVNLRIPVCGLIILLFACWIISCVPATKSIDTAIDQNEWETAQPKDVGLDEETLAELIDRIENDEFQNVHSILIIKDGKLVFEEYFPGYECDWISIIFPRGRGEITPDTQILVYLLQIYPSIPLISQFPSYWKRNSFKLSFWDSLPASSQR